MVDIAQNEIIMQNAQKRPQNCFYLARDVRKHFNLYPSKAFVCSCCVLHYIPVQWIHSSLCNLTISTVSLNLFGVIHSEAQDYHKAMTMMTLVKLNPLSDFEAAKCERVSASVGKIKIN